MADATEKFFDALSRRGYEHLMQMLSGTLRFDITRDGQTDYWRLTVDQGNITVSRDSAEADCVVRLDRALSNRIMGGEMNFFAALLRGTMVVEGNPEKIVLIQGLFPPSTRRHAAASPGGGSHGQR